MERKILDGMDLTIYQTGKGDRLARISHNFSSAEDWNQEKQSNGKVIFNWFIPTRKIGIPQEEVLNLDGISKKWPYHLHSNWNFQKF